MTKRISLAASLLLLGFVAFVFVSRQTDLLGIRRDVVFPVVANRVVPAYPNGELVHVTSGERAAGGYLIPSRGQLIVYFHGNRSTINDDQAFVGQLVRAGFAVLLVEYPGYGISSPGSPSEQAVYADARALVRHVQEARHYGPADTRLVGYSLGTGVAAQLALEKTASGLLLIAPCTSVVDIGARTNPRLMVSLFVVDRFDTLAKAKRIEMPVLIVHGAKDEVMPVEMGRRLDATFPDSRLVVVPEAGHDVIQDAGRGELWEKVRSFLERPKAER